MVMTIFSGNIHQSQSPANVQLTCYRDTPPSYSWIIPPFYLPKWWCHVWRSCDPRGLCDRLPWLQGDGLLLPVYSEKKCMWCQCSLKVFQFCWFIDCCCGPHCLCHWGEEARDHALSCTFCPLLVSTVRYSNRTVTLLEWLYLGL